MTRFLVVGLLLIGVVSPATAQLTTTQRDEARALFEAGRAAFSEGRYEDALGYFERSYEISELPELLYNIGHTAERIRRDARALEAFEAFLAARPDTEGRASIEARIATLRVAVEEHRLAEEARARAEAARAEPAVTEPLDSPSPPPDDPAPLPPPESSGPGVAGWIVLGGGALVAIVGGVLLGLAAASAATVQDAPMGTPWVDVEGAHADADAFGVAGAVLLGVGGAAMAAGLIWGVLELPNETEVALGPGSIQVRGRL